MRSRFSITPDRPNRLMIIRLHSLSGDSIPAPDLIDALAGIEEPWLYNALFDFRRYEAELSRDYLAFLTKKWSALTQGRDRARCMALVSRDYDLKRRLYGMLEIMPERAIDVFDDFDEALDWIKAGPQTWRPDSLRLAS
ncbi:hypothetical protein [Asticcacaulis sp. EMRT-3]|uniref:hypothetical protein n=1 Tax=Asticcacaulis sp. EMRT-3 TaxID=3040349 RepID=UPI0024AF5DED|nr:hypothetical protein [Asticcacaulis sp. EMRT-3]MDI7774660.1 hypothetical protein [Asticcacaulis sp. EMRT-3]